MSVPSPSDPGSWDPRQPPPWPPPPGWAGSDPTAGPGLDPAPGASPATPPAEEPTDRPRGPVLVALVVIVVLAGSALFASGLTLGLQGGFSPGGSAGERELFAPFWEAYRRIATEYVGRVEPRELVEGAIDGMFDAVGDPYSSYMTSREYRESLDDISGEFEGIGAEMRTETPTGGRCDRLGADCALMVVDVIRDSPAEAAGLAAGDRLVGVDGVPVEGSKLDDVVARVKGPKGTEVRLSLFRAGEALELEIVRDVVRTEDVHAQVLGDGTVGYLDVEGFSGSAADDFRELLREQLDAGIRRFVVDVRGDPGGYVDAARDIASEFIASGPVYWEEYADGRQVPTEATGDGLATDPAIRVAVLVDGGSASASEIMAGALQDTGRATLVGERTFGKGTIQQWHLLGDDAGGFRLSVAKWLTPDRRWIHGTGLDPDVPVRDATPGVGDDPQLERAVGLLTEAARPAASPAPPAG